MQHFTPYEWVLIALANSYGNDKVSYQERIDFIKEAIANNKLEEMYSSADEPNMFLAGLVALDDIDAGRPTGFKVGLDATSSGPQFIGIQTGDESCCKLCNVIPTGKRMDLYTEVYNEMRNRAPDMPSDISRSSVKKGVMTSIYGSTAMPKKVFGETYLPLFQQVIGDMMPNVNLFTQIMLNKWDKTADSYSWVMPDLFHVQFDVESVERVSFVFRGHAMETSYRKKAPIEAGRCLGANIAHSLDSLTAREAVRRCNILPKIKTRVERVLDGEDVAPIADDLEAMKLLPQLIEQYRLTNYFSTRIVECINPFTIDTLDSDIAAKAREVLNSIEVNNYNIICIHDCFFTHPNNVEYMRKSVTSAYAELARSNVLDLIMSIIIKEEVIIPKIPNLDAMIMDSDYIIC